MNKWMGKVAVVTGASVGIGAELVKSFASNGIHVVGLARRPEKIDELAKELKESPGKIYSRKCDVTDLQSIEDAFKWIEEEFNTIHILVNNAGMMKNIKILTEEDTRLDISKIINTNFTGLVQVTHQAYRLLKKTNDYGMIININSNAGHKIAFPRVPGTSNNVYPATKFAVTATCEVLRQELILQENDKIRVASISPGVTETELFDTAGFNLTDGSYFENIPAIKAQDVVDALLYLLSTPYYVNVTELTIKHVNQKS